MAESTQHKLDRVRPPRVQITYDVEIGGAIEKKELPFIVGILADLSGKPAEALPPVKDRKFVEIDRDNFNDVLAAISPRLAFRVPNKLVKDSTDQLNVELVFKNMDEFGPVEIIRQVPALKKLYEGRQRLRDLLTKLDGNDGLDALLKDVIQNTESQAALKKDLGEGGEQKPAQ
ncbi:MAG TPA: type VI secretion system contractile sheath small subunit [Stellaceae bacterium]|nr:type VI secretion system contractile sheath small subunit [Stellaceae bacterium]